MQAFSRRFASLALILAVSVSNAPTCCFGVDKSSDAASDTKCDAVVETMASESSGKEDDDGFKHVRTRLDQRYNFDSDGVPFNELLKELAGLFKVDIVIDRVDGKCFNTPVNLHLKHCRAKVVLTQILNQVDDRLSFAVRDGFVLVASRERIDSIQEARVYRNGMLPSMPAGLPSGNYADQQPEEKLRKVICVIEPQTWEQQGGQGRVAYANGNLVVWQNPRVHEQIADLLEQLREADAQDMRDFEKAGVQPFATTPADLPPSLPLPAGPSTIEPTPR